MTNAPFGAPVVNMDDAWKPKTGPKIHEMHEALVSGRASVLVSARFGRAVVCG